MMLLPLIFAVLALAADAALVPRLQQRDLLALAELYDRYRHLAYSLILRIVRRRGIVEDLLRVWNRAQEFDVDRGSMGPWLLARARSRAIGYLYSSGGRERPAVDLEETDHPALFSIMEHIILDAENARRIRAILGKLSPPHREAIELACFEAPSRTEIAERMGQPLGTVDIWVRIALKNLRDDLGAVLPV